MASLRVIALFGLLVLVPASRLCGQTVPMYDTFEWSTTQQYTGSGFGQFGGLTFTAPDGHTFDVESFYDGGAGTGTWRARFMPDEVGTWTYNWGLNTNGGYSSSGSGSFNVTAASNPTKNRGHVKRDPVNPRYLSYDDGTPHYFYGGKWISGPDYGPTSKAGQNNGEYVSDSQFTSYFDKMEAKGHNGLLIKTALAPLEDDGFSWDLGWIGRAEGLVEQMRDRGIYAQVNLFDRWSRPNGVYFDWTTNPGSQPIDAWDTSGSEDWKTRNYIRTMVARFAGYSNVYWELGNEMEGGGQGSAFQTQANAKYIPWIRQYDPYDDDGTGSLPIGLSETVWTGTNVDIGFLHQTDVLPPTSTSGNRPVIMNELVRGGVTSDSLWADGVMRNPAERFGYRRTFWRNFTYGGSGASEATWLRIQTPLNSAANTVMDDHNRLRTFVESFLNINEMNTDTGSVLSGPGQYRTRSKPGEAYATYFMLNPGQSVGAGNVTMSLLSGDYQVKWYDPKTGATVSQSSISASGSTVLPYSGFSEDIALSIIRTGSLPDPVNIFGWEFNTNGNTEGWLANPNAGHVGVSGGTWNLAPNGGDPGLFSNFGGPDLNIDAQLATIVEVTMSATTSGDTNGQLFWRRTGEGFSEDRSQTFQLIANGQPQVYQFNMAGEANWNGSIAQLRLDPMNNGNNSTLAIDSIRLLGYATPGDFNLDGAVDETDLAVWQAGFGQASGAGWGDGDADADGDIDGMDFLAWQANFGATAAAQAVPEPTTALMASVLGLLLMVGRNQRSGQRAT